MLAKRNALFQHGFRNTTAATDQVSQTFRIVCFGLSLVSCAILGQRFRAVVLKPQYTIKMFEHRDRLKTLRNMIDLFQEMVNDKNVGLHFCVCGDFRGT